MRSILLQHILNEVLPVLFQLGQLAHFDMTNPMCITTVNEVAGLLFQLAQISPAFNECESTA